VSALIDSRWHHSPTAETLAAKWGYNIEIAKQTLECTTQENIRSAIQPLTRRYRTDLQSQRLRRLDCHFYTDTLFAKVRSLAGKSCAQIFTNTKGFLYLVPMSTKSDAGYALDQFTQDIGIPNQLTFDGSGAQTGKKTRFREAIQHYRIQPHEVEPYSPFQNRAESAVRIIKSKWKKLMIKRKVPIRLWDFAFVWICEIYSRQSYKGGRTGMEKNTGDTVDISEWVDFSFKI
jgi:hypothetical protein